MVLAAVGVLFIVLTWALRQFGPIVWMTGPICGLWLLYWAACHQRLTIWDDGDRLAIRYGPLPWPLLRPWWIPYQDIREVDVGKTTELESWGVQGLQKGGFIIHIWGDACVALRFDKAVIRLGTDDAENLAAFLKTKISDRPEGTFVGQ